MKFCQNTGKFACSSCKFPDSKDTGYCDFCREVSIIYKIVANFLYWHRENFQLDREKAGNTQGIWKEDLSGGSAVYICNDHGK